MALKRKGDSFGAADNFDTAPLQRTLSPSQDTFGGQVLFMLRTMLGYEPPTEKWPGIKIKSFGDSTDTPKPGSVPGSLLGYLKQMNLDLTSVRSNTLNTLTELQGFRSDTLTELQGLRLDVVTELQGLRSDTLTELQGLRLEQATANAAMIALLQSIDSKTP